MYYVLGDPNFLCSSPAWIALEVSKVFDLYTALTLYGSDYFRVTKRGSVRFFLARASRPPPRKSTKSPFVTCSCQWYVAYLRSFIYRSLASDNDLTLLGSQALETLLQYRRRVPYNTFPSTFNH